MTECSTQPARNFRRSLDPATLPLLLLPGNWFPGRNPPQLPHPVLQTHPLPAPPRCRFRDDPRGLRRAAGAVRAAAESRFPACRSRPESVCLQASSLSRCASGSSVSGTSRQAHHRTRGNFPEAARESAQAAGCQRSVRHKEESRQFPSFHHQYEVWPMVFLKTCENYPDSCRETASV